MKIAYIAVICLFSYIAGVQTMLWRTNHAAPTAAYQKGFDACQEQF